MIRKSIMHELTKLIYFLFSIPARLKGMKLGKNSVIMPGYDFWFISMQGVKVGNNVIIEKNAWIQTLKTHNGNPEIIIGDNTFVSRNIIITAVSGAKIVIGKKCVLGYNVTITGQEHNLFDLNKPPTESGYTKGEKVIIGDECYIGAHTFILKGVHLGKHCVVGANSVVNKSFPDYSFIAGSPARLIRKIT